MSCHRITSRLTLPPMCLTPCLAMNITACRVVSCQGRAADECHQRRGGDGDLGGGRGGKVRALSKHIAPISSNPYLTVHPYCPLSNPYCCCPSRCTAAATGTPLPWCPQSRRAMQRTRLLLLVAGWAGGWERYLTAVSRTGRCHHFTILSVRACLLRAVSCRVHRDRPPRPPCWAAGPAAASSRQALAASSHRPIPSYAPCPPFLPLVPSIPIRRLCVPSYPPDHP